MAFDDVTLFEVHLGGEQFGGEKTRTTERRRESETSRNGDEDAGSGGRSKLWLLAMALVVGGVAFGVRKFRSGGNDEDVEMKYESPGVDVEARSEP